MPCASKLWDISPSIVNTLCMHDGLRSMKMAYANFRSRSGKEGLSTAFLRHVFAAFRGNFKPLTRSQYEKVCSMVR